jgi:deoxyribodipyrimidine photo-lyase
MQTQFKTGLVWFRRDLRTHDNAALSAALASCDTVHCVFVFDREILDALPRADRRVEFIRESLVELDVALRELAAKPHAGLIVMHGWAADSVPALARELGADAVFSARDYEPQAVLRDQKVRAELMAHRISMALVKDHVIFEQREVLTQTGKPYGVFTPYKRAWLARLGDAPPLVPPIALQAPNLADRPPAYATLVPSLDALGFETSNLRQLHIKPGVSGANALLDDFWERMDDYEHTRNFPSVKGPSYLGVHLRFGTISIRHLVGLALQRQLQGSAGAAVWLISIFKF